MGLNYVCDVFFFLKNRIVGNFKGKRSCRRWRHKGSLAPGSSSATGQKLIKGALFNPSFRELLGRNAIFKMRVPQFLCLPAPAARALPRLPADRYHVCREARSLFLS